MTPVDSPHVLLTRAAARLEEAAAEVTPGRWDDREHPDDQRVKYVAIADGPYRGAVVGHIGVAADAAWIAALSPAVAPHLVAWLRYTAKRIEVIGPAFTASPLSSGSQYAPPIAFARTVLGMEAETP